MTPDCPLCDGACADAELGPLLDQDLRWLWEQLAGAADRRGDASLIEGSLSVRAPDAARQRAAAAGLLGPRPMGANQKRRIDLCELTRRLRVRGAKLTPGSVAAHALNRRLATRAEVDSARRAAENELTRVFVEAASAREGMFPEPEQLWSLLRRRGSIARLLANGDSRRLLQLAIEIVARLPCGNARLDRRRLAMDVAGNPHALDHGSQLGGLVLSILVGAGRVPQLQRPRAAWASVGVDCDDLLGGLIALGIYPAGWHLPAGTIVTLPPRLLATCDWPLPDAQEGWVFVTENPSVVAAAADDSCGDTSARVLCTSGTPSAAEIEAIARIASAGWKVAVRADFDAAGLAHVAAVLKAVPRAVPWRMGTSDYVGSLRPSADDETLAPIGEAPWDTELANTMRREGVAAYEESLLPSLLEDLRRGAPVSAAGHAPTANAASHGAGRAR